MKAAPFYLLGLFFFLFLLTPLQSASASWIMDLTPPTAFIQVVCSDNTNTSDGGTCADTTTSATVTITCSDVGSGCLFTKYHIDNQGVITYPPGSNTAIIQNDTAAHTIYINQVQDNVGNLGATPTFTFTFLATPPYLQTNNGDVHVNQ